MPDSVRHTVDETAQTGAEIWAMGILERDFGHGMIESSQWRISALQLGFRNFDYRC
jgi:hypothetical protein